MTVPEIQQAIRSQNAKPFIYSASSGAIAASGSASATLTLGLDSKFLLCAFTATSSLDDPSDAQPENNFTLQITDLSTSQAFSNIALPRPLVTTNIFYGLDNSIPIVFPQGEQFRFDFTNLDAGNANTVTLALQGYKLFGF